MEQTAIDIDSLLGEQNKPAAAAGIDPLIQKVDSWSDGCRDMPIDVRSVAFHSDDGGMWVELKGGQRVDFKRDPLNPKDPKIVHAQKQFCRMLGVPHGFFASNRPSLRDSMIRTWQSGLEPDDRRARCVARLRGGGNVLMLRALFAERAVPPMAVDILKAAKTAFGSSASVVFCHGDDRDDLVLHVRFLFGDSVPAPGGDLNTGFDLVFSELGASPMTVDAILHDPAAMVSFVASYGGEPFFSSKYEGLQPKEVAEMFPALLARIRAQSAEMAETLKGASDGVYSVRQDCLSMTKARGVTSAMRRAVFHELSQGTETCTRMDIAKIVARVAKGFDSLKGLALERAAGRYLNLCFERAATTEKKETADAGTDSRA